MKRALMMTLQRLAFTLMLLCAAAVHVVAAAGSRPPRVAVLDFGETETGRRTARDFSTHLAKGGGVELTDESQARTAARGVGYSGSLNMSLQESRDLAAAIGCDFFITGDSQTIRRTSSAVPVYYEAYASVFVVSGRTGRLLAWRRPHAEAQTPAEAERLLAAQLTRVAAEASQIVTTAAREEVTERERELTAAGVIDMEEVPEEDSPAARGFRAPHPFRRVRPPYPDTANAAEAEATVDASVEIDERGEVLRAEVVRWGGFGLDDSVLAAVRQTHFRPATRDGSPVPVRVLLRYNFRRPQRATRPGAEESQPKLGPAFKELLRTHRQKP